MSTPLFLVIGSHNFSESAFGAIDFKLKSGEPRLRIVNFELSVLVLGEDIEGLLARGKWEEIVTYKRPAARYCVAGPGADKPFSSGAW